jgi:HD-GYP domain-containing protein (c-di-GMP phosphodiesterase class II)
MSASVFVGNHLDSARLREHLTKLAAIGIALSAEQKLPLLLEKIVAEACSFAGADAGTLYLVNEEEDQLEFAVVQNRTMRVRLVEVADPSTWPPVPLTVAGFPNHANVSSHAAISGEIVNIPDVYRAEGFDFSGTKKFDASTGYCSRSMLLIPLQNKEEEIIGVLQLINALDADGRPTIFLSEDVDLIASLASQAAVAITNVRLYQNLENLFDAFIQAIATAIDEKSPHIADHIRRVQALTMEIARAMNAEQEGRFKDFSLNDDQLRELSIAAWLHDIGKIVTPEYVVDKATKLETIFDRIHLIKARYEILKRDLRIKALERALWRLGPASSEPETTNLNSNGKTAAPAAGADLSADGPFAGSDESRGVSPSSAPPICLDEELAAELLRLEEEEQFVVQSNTPGEFMDDDKIARLREIATTIRRNGDQDEPWLSSDELANLCIRKGTLTAKEREIIENHSSVTYKILKQLPFPKKLRKVPEYAAVHHEKLDGSGYPFGLQGDQIDLPARIITIADIFEALTASDRPYREPMPLSQALKIMDSMKKDSNLDPDILELFVNRKIYVDYVKRELNPDQIDC